MQPLMLRKHYEVSLKTFQFHLHQQKLEPVTVQIYFHREKQVRLNNLIHISYKIKYIPFSFISALLQNAVCILNHNNKMLYVNV